MHLAAIPRTRNPQHNTPSKHTGEQEPIGPGHRTAHRASTPVNKSQGAQDTVHATQHTERFIGVSPCSTSIKAYHPKHLHALLADDQQGLSGLVGQTVKWQQNTALLGYCGLAGTPLHVSPVGLGGKECSTPVQDVSYVLLLTQSFCFLSPGCYQTSHSFIHFVLCVICASFLTT